MFADSSSAQDVLEGATQTFVSYPEPSYCVFRPESLDYIYEPESTESVHEPETAASLPDPGTPVCLPDYQTTEKLPNSGTPVSSPSPGSPVSALSSVCQQQAAALPSGFQPRDSSSGIYPTGVSTEVDIRTSLRFLRPPRVFS